MQWELVFCLALGWVLVYFIIYRGLHQSGKVRHRRGCWLAWLTTDD